MSRIRLNNSKKQSRIGTILLNHIINNKREYFIVTILFFIGVITSVIFINNSSEDVLKEINDYLGDLFNNIKNIENIDLLNLLKKSIWNNIIIVILLWFGATTIIGIPIVYGTVITKGFSLGYTISSLIYAYGIKNGSLIALSFMSLHNIIFVPVMLAISVSGVKLYKSIMKNKQRENIKIEILRHTIFCIIMLLLILISSLVETYISTNLAIITIKNINI